ncbi:MAG: maleylpyruvate isomerase family mycothiol-dependent enzyme [Ilumatobacter sp.]|nr:maleylpyruvate isomerase family mycothiol-dependent enzyme [Ilumatobacter sp.]
MTSPIPRERTIAALDEVWGSTADLLASLPPEQWSARSPLAGWDVRDNVAHIVGTESMLLGHDAPAIEIDRDRSPHVRNDIGAFNEVWVEAMRTVEPAAVLARFNEVTAARILALRAMGQDEWDAETFTPAGKDSYGRFMQIRVFDCWLHEQDIRDATGRPGNETGLAVEVTLDEMTTAMGFVVGKRAGVESGHRVTFALTDGGMVVREIHVEVADRAVVVDRLSAPATTTLTMPVGVMTRRCAGRVAPDALRDRIVVTGDPAVAEKILANQSYTI